MVMSSIRFKSLKKIYIRCIIIRQVLKACNLHRLHQSSTFGDLSCCPEPLQDIYLSHSQDMNFNTHAYYIIQTLLYYSAILMVMLSGGVSTSMDCIKIKLPWEKLLPHQAFDNRSVSCIKLLFYF